jgi:hypothetical protein
MTDRQRVKRTGRSETGWCVICAVVLKILSSKRGIYNWRPLVSFFLSLLLLVGLLLFVNDLISFFHLYSQFPRQENLNSSWKSGSLYQHNDQSSEERTSFLSPNVENHYVIGFNLYAFWIWRAGSDIPRIESAHLVTGSQLVTWRHFHFVVVSCLQWVVIDKPNLV